MVIDTIQELLLKGIFNGWALLGLNQRPLACESDQNQLGGVGPRWMKLLNARFFGPLLPLYVGWSWMKEPPFVQRVGTIWEHSQAHEVAIPGTSPRIPHAEPRVDHRQYSCPGQ
jgi:hypothetical protein